MNINYKDYPKHDVVCIDMKSFYASCECVMRGLDPMRAKLAVVGDVNRNGSVVLASSPELKKLGIKTGSRLFEIKNLNDKSIIIAQARMAQYRIFSQRIVDIFREFVPPNQIHVYSVDESFLTLDGLQKLYKKDAYEITKDILFTVYNKIGLIATAGIGENKFLAKVVMDNYGKKNNIAWCRYEDVKKMIHPLPIENMWGVGNQLKKRFHRMRVYTIGDLANADITLIKKAFGVVGVNLFWNAWGIDQSPVIYDKENVPHSVFGFNQEETPKETIKSIGHGITLLKDYSNEKSIKLVIKEIAEEVCTELREKKLAGKTIHLSIGYSKTSNVTGFNRQKTIKEYTNDLNEIIKYCFELFDNNYSKGGIVRQIRIAISHFVDEKEIEIDENAIKKRRLNEAFDMLNNKYGKGFISKASSLTDDSVLKDRSKKTRGHFD